MTAAEIVEELRPLGSDGYRRVLRNHGIQDPMNGFVIAVGSYVPALTDLTLDVAAAIGRVSVRWAGRRAKSRTRRSTSTRLRSAGPSGRSARTRHVSPVCSAGCGLEVLRFGMPMAGD
jgi:hypothetical protein